MEISCSDKARLAKVRLHLLPVNIKLSLAAMFKLNVEDYKPMLYSIHTTIIQHHNNQIDMCSSS